MAEGDRKGNPWLWLAGGCGGLLVLGVLGACIGPSVVGLLMMPEMARPAPSYPGPGVQQEYSGPGGPVLPEPPGPVAPPPGSAATATDRISRTVVFRLDEVEGQIPYPAGTECSATVERRPRADGYWCKADADCAEELLYGGEGQGFFECTMTDPPASRIVGSDDTPTVDDGDPTFRIDTDTDTIVITDDASGPRGAFTLRGTITGLN